MLIYSLLKI